MHFYVIAQRAARPPAGAAYPCVTLERDRWNDFGWVTQFHVQHWMDPHTSAPLGPVKILRREGEGVQVRTELPEQFERLDDQYCSLGQERRYYSFLHRLGAAGREILTALRDTVFDPLIGRSFEPYDAFRDSLLRFSEAGDNYRTAGSLYGRSTDAINGFGFRFTYQAQGFTSPHRVSLNFSERRGLPYRVTAFVGKNGAGKTAVMAEMARQLSGVADVRVGKHGFSPDRPSFSRVVAVSYSPFGPFRYPSQPTSSYRYCGLFDENGHMEGLESRITSAIVDIFEEEREIAWFAALSAAGLFSSEPHLERDLQESIDAERSYKVLRRLSSGHFYAAAILTEVTANVMERSLVLLDEPELFLHPNMVSGLMRALDELLEVDRFDSYAIVATHSPIVVQEIPGQSVQVFVRHGDDPHCQPLEFESFGENLTAITNEVFGATRLDKNYMRILERLSEDHTREQVEELFGGELGLNASAYLRAIASPEGDGRAK